MDYESVRESFFEYISGDDITEKADRNDDDGKEKVNVNIWGKNFNLNVDFSFEGKKKTLPIQKRALNMFLNAKDEMSNALEHVKEFILADEKANVSEKEVENVFKFIVPVKLNVPKSNVVGVQCNYKFDKDHDINIIFKKGKFAKIAKVRVNWDD